MGSKFDKALAGFNTNLKYKGKLYHIQTEDSGKAHPHIITHVFLDGNIVATRKQPYKQHLGREDINDVIKELMKQQHKEMAYMISKGLLDEEREFSVEIDKPSTPPPPEKEKTGDTKTDPGRRSSGIYRKIYRREPTPIPFLPQSIHRRRRKSSKGVAVSKSARHHSPPKEITSGEEQKELEKSDKSLEEIIADFISEKLISD